MFKIGDSVEFGIRYSNGVRKGGIARLKGQIIADDANTIVAKSQNKMYNFRKLKGGWVVETERDDPKGRLYLEIAK